MPAQRGLIVADDLSGANDTGHQLAARGYPTTVVTGESATPEQDSVVVVNTDSRYTDPDEAAKRVANTVAQYPCPFVYKKVDSTLRGNLVAEITAILEATDSDLAVVAPAFPAMGRLTVGGIHVVDGMPVARTPAGRDSDKPVVESHIPTLLETGSFDVRHLPIDEVASSRSAVADRLRTFVDRSDSTVVVCDAVTDSHLERIATGAADLEERVIYVGSGGLARHVRIDSMTSTGILGVAGSVSPRTFEQLSALDEDVIVEIDGQRAVTSPDVVVKEVTNRTAEVLEASSHAVITAAQTSEGVEATIAAGDDEGLSDAETRDRIAMVLARCARAIHRERGFGGLFVTGGAIATTVLNALGGTGIRLTGHAVTEGVPLGRISDGVADGMPLVTKAGAFGEPDTIVKSLHYMSQYDGGQ